MQYSLWHKKVVKKVGPISELTLYFHSALFGLLVFGICYWYTSILKIPNVLNKSVADAAVVLIGFSMLLSSLCYFWNFVDSKIVYRKHLGLVGFAFAVTHIVLSFSALQSLFEVATWQKNAMWPMLTGALAMIIFSIMAAISNQFMATELGGKVWRGILRTGYIGVVLVWAHVILLKAPRWLTWLQGGMKTPPSTSIIISCFLAFVVLMRIALWFSLKPKQA